MGLEDELQAVDVLDPFGMKYYAYGVKENGGKTDYSGTCVDVASAMGGITEGEEEMLLT